MIFKTQKQNPKSKPEIISKIGKIQRLKHIGTKMYFIFRVHIAILFILLLLLYFIIAYCYFFILLFVLYIV